ncbi:hypothetical protein [Amycolatopsis sp. NPDC051716]|uniref:hypothetical protein n=1 Tax=Actinomycetes TaxID=1760 RepID=UPI00342908E0
MSTPKLGSAADLTHDDVQAFARGFGFNSTQHLGDVLAGRAPSALVDERARAADRAAAELRKQRAEEQERDGRWARDKMAELKAAAR